MSLYSWNGIRPKIGKNCYIAPGAHVLGRVTMGDDVSVWFNTVVRGDVGEIIIGDGTNVQDLCMLHITDDLPLEIGNGVSIGHSVTLHSCKIGHNCLIGMGSTILDLAEIGENSLVAAGSVVTPGKKFPPGVMLRGAPAQVVRDLTEEELEGYGQHYLSYIKTKNDYLKQAADFVIK